MGRVLKNRRVSDLPLLISHMRGKIPMETQSLDFFYLKKMGVLKHGKFSVPKTHTFHIDELEDRRRRVEWT
jgi:hypothetical protein